MPNYNNGKIYKLINSIDDQIYIGSTCHTLTTRLNGHKGHAKHSPEQPVYKHLNIIGFNNVNIILIDSYPCLNKLELEQRERHYIDLLKPQLNHNIPTRTDKQYRYDNKDKAKQYYIDNKDKAKQYCDDNKDKTKQYYIDNKDKAKQYYIDNKDKAKQYYIDHKDKISQHRKQYYIDHKDKEIQTIAIHMTNVMQSVGGPDFDMSYISDI